jgi:hypothetical protein
MASDVALQAAVLGAGVLLPAALLAVLEGASLAGRRAEGIL